MAQPTCCRCLPEKSPDYELMCTSPGYIYEHNQQEAVLEASQVHDPMAAYLVVLSSALYERISLVNSTSIGLCHNLALKLRYMTLVMGLVGILSPFVTAYEDASLLESSAKLRMAARQWQTAFCPSQLKTVPYFELPMPISRVRLLMQFRMGSHALPVEQGRLAKPAVPRHLRRCTLCRTRALGDERHFAFCRLQGSDFTKWNWQLKIWLSMHLAWAGG